MAVRRFILVAAGAALIASACGDDGASNPFSASTATVAGSTPAGTVSASKAATTAPAATIADVEVFSTMNIAGVTPGAKTSPKFTLKEPTVITSIVTYHWMPGGAPAPGTIGLQGEDGKTYGPWKAVGTAGQGGVANAYWTVTPNVTLPAGSYLVVDSHPASWSWNTESGGAGMASAKGHPAR